MARIDKIKRELHCKIVYYGAPMVGKSTNIQYIYSHISNEIRSEMSSIATENEHIWFFYFSEDTDILSDYKIYFHLYTSPGVVLHQHYRVKILDDADGIVFVADSQAHMRRENRRSLRELANYLGLQRKTLYSVPIVLQYNKRDITEPVSNKILDRDLNPLGWQRFEAITKEGIGVWETFAAIKMLIVGHLTPFDPSRSSSEEMPWDIVAKTLYQPLPDWLIDRWHS